LGSASPPAASSRYSSFRNFAVVEYEAIPNGFDSSILARPEAHVTRAEVGIDDPFVIDPSLNAILGDSQP